MVFSSLKDMHENFWLKGNVSEGTMSWFGNDTSIVAHRGDKSYLLT